MKEWPRYQAIKSPENWQELLDHLIKQMVEHDSFSNKPRIIKTKFDFDSEGKLITSNAHYEPTNLDYTIGHYYPSSSIYSIQPLSEPEYARFSRFCGDLSKQVREARERAEAAEAERIAMQWSPGKTFM